MPKGNQKNLVSRPPVVVVMGHIDHGKSTLLDYIRKTNIVAGEAGGITQHIGAYEASFKGADDKEHMITFLDTPGHEAFCNIRERGAKAADIAILVVSAEDGVKPQTIEVFKNIKEEKMPFIVAITKIDKPNANVEKAKQSLGENEIYVEGWGGDVPCVPVSAVTGEGIKDLLEMIMLVAELGSLQTDPTLTAMGTVIESELDTRKGISATLLIKDGTLHVGDFVVAEGSYSPVRYIEDFKGLKIEKAVAGMPVVIVGWNEIPECGADFGTAETKKKAESTAHEFMVKMKDENAKKAKEASLKKKTPDSNDKNGNEENKLITIPIIIRADVIGSLEGVKHELEKIKHDKVALKIVSEGIGDINENDVKVAQGDPRVELIGFNVMPDNKAAAIIERNSIPLNVSSFKVIYQLTEYVKALVAKNIPKEYEEISTGRAKIMAVFSHEKDRQVVGGKVEKGTLESGNDVKIMRREVEIGRGKIRELQQAKKRTDEVREGFEFGTMIEAKVEIAAGDRVEAVKTIEKK